MLRCLVFYVAVYVPLQVFRSSVSAAPIPRRHSPEKRKHSGIDEEEEEEEEEEEAAEADEEEMSEATDHSSGKCHATRLNLMFCINTGEALILDWFVSIR